jgi:hypothetical protein
LTATTRPSTQELVSGGRKSVVLGTLPLRMMVPESWEIEKLGDSISLQGPTPKGSVRIRLSQVLQQSGPLAGSPVVFTKETLELRERKAKKDAAASNGTLELIPLHQLGMSAQVMERRETYEGQVRGFDGEPQPAKMMDWTVEVYVPQEQNYELDLLHFSTISVAQYTQDKDFLENLLGTLHYDAARGAVDLN